MLGSAYGWLKRKRRMKLWVVREEIYKRLAYAVVTLL